MCYIFIRRYQMSRKKEIIGHCDQCGHSIATADEACQAMGTLFHTTCFLCHTCGCSLKASSFYYVSGFVYCEKDFKSGGFFDKESQMLDSCSTCHKPIYDATLIALKRRYHRECFSCSVCHRILAEEPFCPSPVDPCSPICLEDYWRSIAPVCHLCSKPILPSGKPGESHTLIIAKLGHHADLACSNGKAREVNLEPWSCHPHCLSLSVPGK